MMNSLNNKEELMETNSLNTEILKSFNSLVVLDINADKVSIYDSNLKEVSSYGFEDYLNNLKKVIHPDFIKSYYEQISLNNLTSDETKIISYQKLSDMLSYDYYYDFIRVVDDNSKVLINFHIPMTTLFALQVWFNGCHVCDMCVM